ncbi:MAG: hypothetical protein NT029_03905 [Armatimonadetes bacterium]|nr:hypothetical protein [Armatimonadota bacterium]
MGPSLPRRALPWVAAAMLTLGTMAYQDKTGPTYPLEVTVTTAAGPAHGLFLRSETIGTPLQVMLVDPVPSGVSARVRYRRLKSNDGWTTVDMRRGEFTMTRRGRKRVIRGLGVELPSLRERAGKYEYFVDVTGGGATVSATGSKPIYARYKAPVPGPVLGLHILAIFASLLVAVRTALAALGGGSLKALLRWTLALLLVGGFVLGPIVQWYAFGVLWSGFPYGYDWTDNKVVVELAFWLVAIWRNRGERRDRWSVVVAGVATLAIFLVPHSIFGSEYNYITGKGHGTTG